MKIRAISYQLSATRHFHRRMGELTDREQTIIKERHLGHETVTLEKLGEELGVSKERVRQLEQRAMSKLRSSISRHIDHGESLYG